MRALVFGYVFLMPFMSALGLAEWLPLPLVLLLLASPWILARGGAASLRTARSGDGAWLAMFLLGCVAIALSPWPSGGKHVNYSAAILVSYGVFFFVARSLVLSPGVGWTEISRAATAALLFLSCAVVIEFISASFYGVFFSDLVPYTHKDLNIANFIDDRFKRPRAFAHEPGFTALAFECLWPLTWLDRRRGFVLRQALHAAGFLLLGSAAGTGCLLFGAGLWWVVRSRDWKRSLMFAGALVAVVVPITLTESGADALWSLFGRKFDIFTMDVADAQEGVTVLERLGTWAVGLDLVGAHPLGIGWGGLAQLFADQVYLPDNGTLNGSGMLCLPLDVAVAAGVPGLLALVAFVGLRWRRAFTSRSPAAMAVGVGLVSLSGHHLFITEFQFPFLWFALALADRLWLEAERPVVRLEAGQASRANGSDKLSAPL